MPSHTPDDPAGFQERLCQRLMDGESLDAICATPGWPSRPTLRKWARESALFASYIAHGQAERRKRERHPLRPEVAQRLIQRLKFGEALGDLIRQPDMPHRRELNAWKRQDPAFAAELQAAKAFADVDRRRCGRPRRSRMPYDEATADRLMLAVLRGATLPNLARDPTLPSALGLERWRKADPEFDSALRGAMIVGHKARGRARTDARCSPRLRRRIAERILQGASLHSLSKRPDMPGLHALYKWVRERPDFAHDVAVASRFRDEILLDSLLDLARLATPGAGALIARETGAIAKRLGQLRPYPGERQRG